MKHISILGSTGSIGTQALDVIRQFPGKLKVVALSGHTNINLLIEQVREFKPEIVHVSEDKNLEDLKNAIKTSGTKLITGKEELINIATYPKSDMVLSAIVGFAGLIPTIEAIKAGKDIALANKETLVVAGDLVMDLAAKHNVNIIPVDSEHSAIFQCMQGEDYDMVRRIILTASGGPFRTTDLKKLQKVSVKDALNHPNWSMGNKITIDSATMMNKGLEVIEAYHLFKIPPFKIEVIVHPESIVHSLVEFKDRSIKAQLGLPDMRVPIQYALTYPDRAKNTFEEFSFTKYAALHFEQPDIKRFPALDIAFEAIRRGGNTPCIINAANEIAVNAFLKEKIRFMQIPKIVEETMESATPCVNPSINDLLETDIESRKIAEELIK
ncbi:MAG: 1-deoxy-D-xylulose-5-phosphate reductoisomerase [Salinivirgaceae bacterium]|nr:MAG: 1-deoxy-D-xylulose-5-phosphate reductoisomerase [Salinivirgaceae bacterium]